MILALAAATVMSLNSTAYCLRGTMADGTPVRYNSVAMNSVPLGTKIKVIRPKNGVFGRKYFVVRDRIGYGSQADFWMHSCTQARQWGRRQVTVKVVKKIPTKKVNRRAAKDKL